MGCIELMAYWCLHLCICLSVYVSTIRSFSNMWPNPTKPRTSRKTCFWVNSHERWLAQNYFQIFKLVFSCLLSGEQWSFHMPERIYSNEIFFSNKRMYQHERAEHVITRGKRSRSAPLPRLTEQKGCSWYSSMLTSIVQKRCLNWTTSCFTAQAFSKFSTQRNLAPKRNKYDQYS